MPVGPLSGPARDYDCRVQPQRHRLVAGQRALAFAKIQPAPKPYGGAHLKMPVRLFVPPTPTAGIVVAAAARLHIPLTPHAVVAQRATEAVDRIDAALKTAQRRGDLVFFNGLYQGPAPGRGGSWGGFYELRHSAAPSAQSRCWCRCAWGRVCRGR